MGVTTGATFTPHKKGSLELPIPTTSVGSSFGGKSFVYCKNNQGVNSHAGCVFGEGTKT